ncbi:TRAP transporter small permease [Reyranella aquatilis]|jgi:TRAP-type C4-dicarboxylate transport system permease small subunit|uniref:TRAP transporter small permease protein n=1 Tax=Reyranella aquatilis TaxID=2035356 RepID=A0ABS8L0A5_9HYPH|nr:TRAP transporter small permease [Reyranella aquatilis]MCC8431298.1 TRAP transporter small permease [Reyranella aquatilis]
MGWMRTAERLGAALALAGAALSLFIAGLVTASVGLRWATSSGLPGDFEMVQMAVALAIFSFLPYTQLRRGNMLVDTFTIRLPARVLSAIDAFWDIVYAAAAALLGWRLAVGAADAIGSRTSTMVLGMPVGWAIMACAAMAGLLALAALVTAAGRFRTEP